MRTCRPIWPSGPAHPCETPRPVDPTFCTVVACKGLSKCACSPSVETPESFKRSPLRSIGQAYVPSRRPRSAPLLRLRISRNSLLLQCSFALHAAPPLSLIAEASTGISLAGSVVRTHREQKVPVNGQERSLTAATPQIARTRTCPEGKMKIWGRVAGIHRGFLHESPALRARDQITVGIVPAGHTVWNHFLCRLCESHTKARAMPFPTPPRSYLCPEPISHLREAAEGSSSTPGGI